MDATAVKTRKDARFDRIVERMRVQIGLDDAWIRRRLWARRKKTTPFAIEANGEFKLANRFGKLAKA